MVRKGVAIWIFSTLSFIAAIHAFEAGVWLFLNREPTLLRNYPIINELKKPSVCLTCGKAVQPDFNICPYCGENLKLIPQKIIKAYR